MPNSTGNYIRVTVHVRDGEAFMADIDDLPGPTDMFVRLHNLRRRDDKPVTWLAPNVHTVVYSAAYITFIEVHDSTKPLDWVVR